MMHISYLKVGDKIVDINNKDASMLGNGLGTIEKISDKFFYVKFSNKNVQSTILVSIRILFILNIFCLHIFISN